MPPNPTAAVIIARNEAASLPSVIEGARRHVEAVWVVDGRSTDGTDRIARELGARVLVDNGMGKGAAIRQALEAIEADRLVFLDADGSHNPEEIPRFFEAFEKRPEAMLVTGSRVKGGSDELHGNLSKFLRMIGSHILTYLVDLRWGVELTDIQNGYRAVRRDFVRRLNLRENGFTIEEEMIMEVLRHGGTIVEVPTHEYERKHGESHIRLWKVSLRFLWVVLRTIMKPDTRLP